MNGKQLKNSILQWAIQGKLVEQNPKDEPASKLLERIAAQKAVVNGAKQSSSVIPASEPGPRSSSKKAKSSKAPISRIYRENGSWFEQVGSAEPKDITEEIPFDIPESWEWCRLHSLAKVMSSKRVFEKDYVSEGIPFFRSKEIGDLYRGENIKTELYITESHYVDLKDKYGVPDVGDILITSVGTIGNTWVCDGRKFYYKDGNITQICKNQSFESEYLETFLHAPVFFEQVFGTVAGTAYNALTIVKLNNLLVPLPPLEEQKRIVKKLEQILPLVDEYDQAQTQLDKLNKELPESLKKSILQQAIQGKLVPQNPNDEPAQALLDRISAERVIASGAKQSKKSSAKVQNSRIYRDTDGLWYEQIGTSEPVDISEEIPFEIPETWVWCRWGEISNSIQYGFNAPALASGRIKMVRISDIQDNRILWEKVPFCQITDTEIDQYRLKKNDILFARTGGTVGKSYLVQDIAEDAVFAGYLIRTTYNYNLLVPQYLKFFMESSLYWSQLREGTIATAQPNCNGKTLGKMLIPLPPLAEQKRIVAKLEELFEVI